MDDSSLIEYRRVSVLAILALLLGFTSSGALIGKVLLALPVAGLGVGLLAISKINTSEGHYSGRVLAQWGIFFSVIFGVAAVVRPPLFQAIIERECQTFAHDWLQLVVAGDSQLALKHVGMKTKSQLVPQQVQGKPNADDDMGEMILLAFRTDPVIQQLQTAGKQVSVHYEQTIAKPLPSDRQIGVVQTFSITSNDSEPQNGTVPQSTFYVQLYLTRSQSTEDQPAVWFVNRWELATELSEVVSGQAKLFM